MCFPTAGGGKLATYFTCDKLAFVIFEQIGIKQSKVKRRRFDFFQLYFIFALECKKKTNKVLIVLQENKDLSQTQNHTNENDTNKDSYLQTHT